MSLVNTLLPMTQSCAGKSGGVARLWLFDPADYNFTQAAFSPTTGFAPYTAIAEVTGAAAAGAAMLPIKFERDECEFKASQSRKGSSSKWELSIEFKVAELKQLITNWNYFVDAACICGGLGLMVQLNTGVILVLGEEVVNGNAVDIPLYMLQDGSSITSGKLMDDFIGQTVVLKGNYKRLPNEYTGGLQSIIDLQ